MKNITSFLIALFLTVVISYSQNLIDPQSIGADPTFFDANIFDKNFNDFKLTWNYGSKGRQFDRLNHTNFCQFSIFNFQFAKPTSGTSSHLRQRRT